MTSRLRRRGCKGGALSGVARTPLGMCLAHAQAECSLGRNGMGGRGCQHMGGHGAHKDPAIPESKHDAYLGDLRLGTAHQWAPLTNHIEAKMK